MHQVVVVPGPGDVLLPHKVLKFEVVVLAQQLEEPGMGACVCMSGCASSLLERDEVAVGMRYIRGVR